MVMYCFRSVNHSACSNSCLTNEFTCQTFVIEVYSRDISECNVKVKHYFSILKDDFRFLSFLILTYVCSIQGILHSKKRSINLFTIDENIDMIWIIDMKGMCAPQCLKSSHWSKRNAFQITLDNVIILAINNVYLTNGPSRVERFEQICANTN